MRRHYILLSLTVTLVTIAVARDHFDLPLIDHFDEFVQHRFQDPLPRTLGMSRVVQPPSFGEHFQPLITMRQDFHPESPAESQALKALEDNGVQLGFYLFGARIIDGSPEAPDFRALKGPAVITRGTPRPAWYPGLPKPSETKSGETRTSETNLDALPDWEAIYPLARRAMASFQDGGAGFETTFKHWNIAARPVIASQERCVACHNNPAYHSKVVVKLNSPIGGVLYAYRRT